ncbi:alpha/beta hydrolase [Gracilibacillus oryzae]|uniref:Alpha/beta hydrolase n=1 Tax=Gracilibacillus oryzae TaxID=1672701 RepID=A0A7C8KM61_9BACI|nr:alpha/beta hydrolase [Gracilibacillus oryzae]KAB8125735.1 alpha/beta hydrolase [Gracilibacillus oryzae]
MKKKFKIAVISIVAILLLTDVFAGNFFYNLAIKREQKDFLQGNEDLTVSAAAMDVFLKGGWRQWVQQQDFDQMELESFDGLTLKGYYLAAKEPTNKTVMLAHGYLGNAKDMGLYGQYYYEQLGYNIFMPDARGHGQSEGDYIGFGWHDRLDWIDWTEKLIGHTGTDAQIIWHGLSMGAATVLMASGEEHPENVELIVSDSAYTSVFELFQYQMKRMYHLPAFPILPTSSLITKLRADYSLVEASALEQVKNAQVPIIYFHGNNDSFVPAEMAETLYQHTTGDKEIMLFDNAGHGEAYAIQEEKYQEQLKNSLQKYIE